MRLTFFEVAMFRKNIHHIIDGGKNPLFGVKPVVLP